MVVILKFIKDKIFIFTALPYQFKMNILLAPDSFKDALSASEVCFFMEKGIQNVMPDAEINSIPMADGGEGTLDALIAATGGKIVKSATVDALMRRIESRYAILGDGKTAVIELAHASGLELLKPKERKALNTNTLGTGLLIRDAFQKGCRKFIICIGGSATHDIGTGILNALGVRFFDIHEKEITPTGGSLGAIRRMEMDDFYAQLSGCEFQVVCDVSNPLLGEQGAAKVFSRQKGASEKQVLQLEESTRHFSLLLNQFANKDVVSIPGSGAAGGVGAGLVTFLNAQMESGFEIVARTVGLEKAIQKADLIFTGEGKVDFQTQFGKTPFGVAQLAKQYGKPVVCLVGSIGEGADVLYSKGITSIFSIANRPLRLQESIKSTPELIEQATENIMRTIHFYKIT